MDRMKLYHFPGACSRVVLTALEHVGANYEDELVNLKAGQQQSPEYLAINPKGMVSALIVDGELLTETSAILWWLHRKFPEAGLLPATADEFAQARQLSDLIWFSAGWHPAVRANAMPMRFTVGDIEPVRAQGKMLVKPLFEKLDALLQTQPWWYGEDWSILDTYAYWCYTTAELGEYDLSGLDAIADHRRRVSAHPAFQRAIAREDKALAAIG